MNLPEVVLVITFYSCLGPSLARQVPSHRQGCRDALENRTSVEIPKYQYVEFDFTALPEMW
jgi:hypothetical protein